MQEIPDCDFKEFRDDEAGYKMIARLAKHHATAEEIAWTIGVSVNDFRKNARAMKIIERAHASVKVWLREKQLEKAGDGSDTMLQWLGANYLGQTSKREIKGDVRSTVQVYVPQNDEISKFEVDE